MNKKTFDIKLYRAPLPMRAVWRRIAELKRFTGGIPANANEVWQRFKDERGGRWKLPECWTFSMVDEGDKGMILRFFSHTRASWSQYDHWNRRRIKRLSERPLGVRCEFRVTKDTVLLLDRCSGPGDNGTYTMLALLGLRERLELPYNYAPRGLDLRTLTAVRNWNRRWGARQIRKPWEDEFMKCAYWRSFKEAESIATDIQRSGHSVQSARVFADHKRVEKLVGKKLTQTQREVVTLLGGTGSENLIDYLTPEHMEVLQALDIPKPKLLIKAAEKSRDKKFKGWGWTCFRFSLREVPR